MSFVYHFVQIDLCNYDDWSIKFCYLGRDDGLIKICFQSEGDQLRVYTLLRVYKYVHIKRVEPNLDNYVSGNEPLKLNKLTCSTNADYEILRLVSNNNIQEQDE